MNPHWVPRAGDGAEIRFVSQVSLIPGQARGLVWVHYRIFETSDQDRVLGFYERQVLALMDHPCIARVIDAGATQMGRLFFVMEFVEGVRITADDAYIKESILTPNVSVIAGYQPGMETTGTTLTQQALGAHIGGWSLYAHDGKLKHCYNFFGIEKYFAETCLMEQAFVKDPDRTMFYWQPIGSDRWTRAGLRPRHCGWTPRCWRTGPTPEPVRSSTSRQPKSLS